MKKRSAILTVGITCAFLLMSACVGQDPGKGETAQQDIVTDGGTNISSETAHTPAGENASGEIINDNTTTNEAATGDNTSDNKAGNGQSPANENGKQVGQTRKINTASQYSTSFRKAVGEDMEVVYLGMPRRLKGSESEGTEWTTSDERVATVCDGIVTGWSEGMVTITQKQEDKVLTEWQFAVTTFNDGRQVEGSFELGREEIDRLLVDECGVHEPAFWQSHVNTIQDVITYFQESGFMLNYDLPILCTADSEWLWSIPGDMILIENSGSYTDLADAACYLLQNDFEDQGFILVFGNDSKVLSWFYEDGCYYLVSFRQLMRDIRDGKREETYVPFKAESFEEFKSEVLNQVNLEETLTILMTSNQGHDFQPPVYLSYLHDSSEIYYKHVVIGLEDAILSGTQILYASTDFDYEIRSIPTDEMPKGLPRYGEPSGNLYEYE